MRPLSLLPTLLLLGGCVGYEPAALVPSITLSPERVMAADAADGAAVRHLDFGIEVSVNESDSLVNLETLPGVRVRGVTPGGAAATAGIQAGDVVLSVNGMNADHPDAFAVLETQEPSGGREPSAQQGQPYLFRVRRNTQLLETQVTPRRLSQDGAEPGGPGNIVELYRIDPIATRAGYDTRLVQMANGPDLPAARIRELFPLSPLPAAGLAPGDLILSLDGHPINSAQDLITRLNQYGETGRRVRLGVYNGNGGSDSTLREVEVRLWHPGRRLSRIALGPLLQYRADAGTDSASLSILDFWLFAFYRHTRNGSERSHTLLELFTISSDLGTLTDVTEAED